GNKPDNQLYTEDDILTFDTLAAQTALAIENCQFAQELADKERLAAMGKFAASIVHEVKNPLTAIKTFTEFLPQKYQDKSFIDKYSAVVSKEVDKMDGLARELLDFARPHPLELAETDIAQLIDDALEMLSSDFLKHNVKVVKELCTLRLKVDPGRLKQAFLNLFLNAIDAMPSGGTLTIKTHLCSSDKKFVTICVQDTGIGISKQDLPHLFEPFHSTKKGGTGLGLAVTYGIIKEHGGKIRVESKFNEGTAFIIELSLFNLA
ncbi:MAG: ATP-binding protein, partial [Candidatus Omnitrophota bacterium]